MHRATRGTLGSSTIGLDYSNNALGISSSGRYAYTVTNAAGSKVLAKHDRVTDSTSRTTFTLNSSVLRGAVHPVTGVYYFASGTSVNGTINLYAWNESVTPQAYVQVGTLRPTADSTAFGANGDMAFSASGQLVLVADNVIYSSDLPTSLVLATRPSRPSRSTTWVPVCRATASPSVTSGTSSCRSPVAIRGSSRSIFRAG